MRFKLIHINLITVLYYWCFTY